MFKRTMKPPSLSWGFLFWITVSKSLVGDGGV
jgi:hypothetical protein